jgi:hypothetical protein
MDSYRQVCNFTFEQLEKCQYVEGIHICSSGGIEIAKTKCRKYSGTSSHVFTDQIVFEKAYACPPYGILGVIVRVSYVSHKNGDSCAIFSYSKKADSRAAKQTIHNSFYQVHTGGQLAVLLQNYLE